MTAPPSTDSRFRGLYDRHFLDVRNYFKGLKFVFEEEVHGNVFAEEGFNTESGFWCPTLIGDPENLVFLAMQSSGDKWTWFEVTVTPRHIPEVCDPPT